MMSNSQPTQHYRKKLEKKLIKKKKKKPLVNWINSRNSWSMLWECDNSLKNKYNIKGCN
jgi:hypothetical protein